MRLFHLSYLLSRLAHAYWRADQIQDSCYHVLRSGGGEDLARLRFGGGETRPGCAAVVEKTRLETAH
jgi:hypothetical protein